MEVGEELMRALEGLQREEGEKESGTEEEEEVEETEEVAGRETGVVVVRTVEQDSLNTSSPPQALSSGPGTRSGQVGLCMGPERSRNRMCFSLPVPAGRWSLGSLGP